MKTREQILEDWPTITRGRTMGMGPNLVPIIEQVEAGESRQNAILRDLLLDVRGMMAEVMASAPEYYGMPIMEMVKKLNNEVDGA